MGFFEKLFGIQPATGPKNRTRRGEVSAYTYNGTVIEYFDMLLDKHFPEYESEMMVYPRNIDFHAEFDCYPISFLLRKASRPVLALLLVPSDRWNTVNILHTEESCTRQNIPFLRFMNDFRNEEGYVVNRIRKAL